MTPMPHLRLVKPEAEAIRVFTYENRLGNRYYLHEGKTKTGKARYFFEERMKKAQYAPVMKFEIEGDHYAVFRMTYRGHGGWSYPLATGKLQDLVKKFLPSVGTEKFFDLM
jgi:hypothetical protein